MLINKNQTEPGCKQKSQDSSSLPFKQSSVNSSYPCKEISEKTLLCDEISRSNEIGKKSYECDDVVDGQQNRWCTSPSNITNYTSISLNDDEDNTEIDDFDQLDSSSVFLSDCVIADKCVPSVTAITQQQPQPCCASNQNNVCLHKMRRFEPPPPYTLQCNDDRSKDPIAFV